jgi:hypothetical protein
MLHYEAKHHDRDNDKPDVHFIAFIVNNRCELTFCRVNAAIHARL